MAMAGPGPAAKVKPQPDIYTLLLILTVLALGAVAGYLIHNLMTVYGLTFTELFTGQEIP